MFPNLYFVIEGLFGVKPPQFFSIVQTFGLFLAISFILAGVALSYEMKRRTALGQFKPVTREKVISKTPSIPDLLLNMLIGFLLGFKLIYAIQNSDKVLEDMSGFLLSGTGNWVGGLLGAVLLSGWVYWENSREAKKYKDVDKIKVKMQPNEFVGDILIVAAISGIIGAKLFAMVEYPIEQWTLDNLLSGSGLAVYGGLIMGFFAVAIYIRRLGFKPIYMVDAAAPSLLLGQGLGRFGCHFSGDGDWGIVNTNPKPVSWLPDWLWSYTYPNNVNGKGDLIPDCPGQFYTDDYCYELPEGVYPTSPYEIIMLVGLFAIFWLVIRHRVKAPGVIFSLYLILSSIERFLIEFIRVNDKYMFNLSQAQIIAVVLMLIGVVGIFYFNNQYKKSRGVATS